MRLAKLSLDRKWYWIVTAIMTAAQLFGPEAVGYALFVPWFVLYLARLRNAGRSALHLLHLVPVVVLILVPMFIVPGAATAYLGGSVSAPEPSTRDTLLFLAFMLSAIAYYLAFAIWLGCIRSKTSPQATVADTFS